MVTGGAGVKTGNGLAASSSKVSVTLVIGSQQPPASDMILALCPAGPINSMSISPGLPWLMFFSLTVALVIEPGIPATTILEG